eukprot:gnl/TRDRNA2_/TRDRNA2_154592_c1_seq1.p1 gnl/TRDRNA2_/TRDRNA2_154592_c1~~gnl/TRDRNA2_/TRDRNA2_154592_c1_seq1.p1  ORF type:complete len:488 (+),score=83.73 gnl/TRDRNA2_/TRDRNA2_154592_c1_seq1:210-1466(+)
MVVERLTDAVAEAARISHLIENKGQCTAMRHFVMPCASEADIARVYQPGSVSSLIEDAPEALERNDCAGVFKKRKLEHPIEGYKRAPGELAGHAAFKVDSALPSSINEQWREAYLDVTAPAALDDAFIKELATWCGRMQPISLAMNVNLELAKRLFELTSLVVYTFGGDLDSKPALTCQARPQDGECFGELPPRRELGRLTRFPVIVPTATPGYNSSYAPSFLETQGQVPYQSWNLPKELERSAAVAAEVKDDKRRGFCRQILAYLADAARGPRRGVGARATLFGLQRPPLEQGVTCIRLEGEADIDDFVPFVLPFLATNARKQLVVSADPSLTLPASMHEAGIKIEQQTRAAFDQLESSYWNVVSFPNDAFAQTDHPIAAHFVSRLLPFGHVKSSKTDDPAFIDAVSSSEKWLRVEV